VNIPIIPVYCALLQVMKQYQRLHTGFFFN